MRRLLTTLALVPLLSFGCDDGAETAAPEPAGLTELRQALPAAEAMTIQMPHHDALTPSQAMFYGFTRGITLNVNGLVRDITNVIEDVVELPPTDTDGETYAVWGPWTEALSPATYRVRVVRGEGVGFDYVVEGWPKNQDEAAAVTLLEGHHEAGAAPQQGVGQWRFDLSAARGLDPIAHESLGTIAVAYDLAEARVLEVNFEDVQGPHDADTTSTRYRYTEAADGAGTFDYISNLDIHKDDNPELDRRELVQVRSRWLANGPGRADVLATHGDLVEGVQVNLEECWDDAFMRSYLSIGFPGAAQVEGEAAACPYADRQLPAFDDFDADAFADGDLIAALPDISDFEMEPAPVSEEADETAMYYQIAKQTIEGLRFHVGGVLEMVRNISRNPPSRCDEDGCRWGPWTDWETRQSLVLFIARNEDGSLSYRMMMQYFGDGDDAWQTLVEGGFLETGAERGQGWFLYDLGVLATFNDQEDNVGIFRAEYAQEGARSMLSVRLDQVTFQPGDAPADARYFIAVEDGAGHLDLRVATDVHEDDPSMSQVELLDARIRWDATGAGVGDAFVTGGDIAGDAEVLAVECWDDHAAQTHVGYLQRDVGSQQTPTLDGPGCVFTDWQDVEFPVMGDEG